MEDPVTKGRANNIVTLQLSVPALERLFEGDPEFLLSLRQAVVAEFVRRNVKGLLDKALEVECARVANETIGKWESYPSSRVALKKEYESSVKSVAVGVVEEARKQLIAYAEQCAVTGVKGIEADIEATIEERVRRAITSVVTNRIREEVQTKVKAILAVVDREEGR